MYIYAYVHIFTYDINKAIYNNDILFEVKYFIIIYEVANWNFLLSINFYNYYKDSKHWSKILLRLNQNVLIFKQCTKTLRFIYSNPRHIDRNGKCHLTTSCTCQNILPQECNKHLFKSISFISG